MLPLPSARADPPPQEITETERLDFGSFAVRAGNLQAASITVTPDNDVSADDGIVLGDGAHRGEYHFTGLPPNVTFYLGVDMPQSASEGGIVLAPSMPASQGGGPTLELTDLTISNGGSMVSDGAGEATVYIGGTLRTNGTGQLYDGGSYFGAYNITIYY